MNLQNAQSLQNLHLNPKKLLRSKWTAAIPQNKEKHFMVIKLITLITPMLPLTQIELIELEAVHSKRSFVLPWRELNDKNYWIQGWK